ncbi:hypothetical protein ACWT_5649 [Actinoplanes sp. SE50]|uniref:hypothetical protein n=1 Tax=unclassified Actinoplanes TaxID=2626549 RepID=UPI00023ED10D|nr:MULTISPECIES: hypothetical protein [unclassified Actinoplanes]AEV86666.1 hypothetical protein ACPL_5779 [Actinoplanes sp. SE50/110]ATO85064.1 hypothetical protein ACWT_5649 [Actinoplanes sp. SE50]SLM02475.1 hypothetical protein ACSP50_5725 [Actinoplanes sp. SE50/110]
MFSVAQFEAVIAEINQGKQTYDAKIAQVIPAADHLASQWWVADVIAEAIHYLAKETVDLATEIGNFILDLLKGCGAPIFMFRDSWTWTDIKSGFSAVSTQLTTQNLVVDDSKWAGDAKDAYLTVAEAQSAAAGRLSSIAGNTSNSLLECAIAGSAFYLTVAAVLAKLIVAAAASVAAFSSAIFSEIGAMIFLEEGGVNITALATAAGLLSGFLGDQARVMISLHSDSSDPANFPGGMWPRTNASAFSDATVKDGDADWSLKKD